MSAASAAAPIMPTARAVSSVPAARLAIPNRCSAYSGTSALKPSAAAPYRKLSRFITPKPRPTSSRAGMNGAGARRACRTNSTSDAAATSSGPTKAGDSGDPLPR